MLPVIDITQAHHLPIFGWISIRNFMPQRNDSSFDLVTLFLLSIFFRFFCWRPIGRMQEVPPV